MIQANCRSHFTIDDFTFITEALGTDERNRIALSDLLTDEEMRDRILDHEELFNRIRQQKGLTRISPHLFFYVMIRHAFREYNIESRHIADYVASMLAEFSSTNSAHTPTASSKSYNYLVDIMMDFAESSSSLEAFLLRSHLGNYSLFMTGIFPDFINRKAMYGSRAPGFDYYEKMGRSSYLWASRHKVARKYNLVEVLASLARQFRVVRQALNWVSDEYIHLDESSEDIDEVLRKIFYNDRRELN